jgi:hypothetical protein
MNIDWAKVDTRIDTLTDQDIECGARELAETINETDHVCQDYFKDIHCVNKL